MDAILTGGRLTAGNRNEGCDEQRSENGDAIKEGLFKSSGAASRESATASCGNARGIFSAANPHGICVKCDFWVTREKPDEIGCDR